MMIHIERLDGDKIISHDGLVFEGGQENRVIKVNGKTIADWSLDSIQTQEV